MPYIGIRISPTSKRSRKGGTTTFINAVGGTVTIDGNLKRHVLNVGDTFQILSGVGLPFRVMAISGGGGGGALGGGSGGGVYYNGAYLSEIKTYSITVGLGGQGSLSGVGSNSRGSNGGNTIFDTQTILGGGGGGGFSNTEQDGANGGNGGGGGAELSPTFAGGIGGTGFKNGGNGDPSNNATSGGGGGAYDSNGFNATANNGGNGANGFQSNILGALTWYAGAGGGGGETVRGLGGLGGGGNGALLAGSGGGASFYGGGGGGGYGTTGGAGSNGVIAIEYAFDNASNFKLIVVGGQSNGTDRFNILGNLPTEMQGLQSYATYYKNTDNATDNGSWVQANSGVNTQTGTPQTNKFSVMVSCAYKLRNSYNTKSFVIPTGLSSTYIANDVTPSWNVSHSNEYYNRMTALHFTPAIAKLFSGVQSLSPVLVWVHGENDSDTLAHGNAYQANLTALISAFRTYTGFPNAKVIIVKIRPDYGGPSLGLASVRTAIDNIAGGDANVIVLDANASDTTLSADTQHYNPVVDSFGGIQSAVNLGYKLADIISTL